MNRTYTARIVISFPLGVNRLRYNQEKDYRFTFEKPNRTELNTIHSQFQRQKKFTLSKLIGFVYYKFCLNI